MVVADAHAEVGVSVASGQGLPDMDPNFSVLLKNCLGASVPNLDAVGSHVRQRRGGGVGGLGLGSSSQSA